MLENTVGARSLLRSFKGRLEKHLEDRGIGVAKEGVANPWS